MYVLNPGFLVSNLTEQCSVVLGQWNIVRRESVSCELVLGSCVNLTTACNVQVDYYPNIS